MSTIWVNGMKLTNDGESSYKILSMPIVSPSVTRIKIEECGEALVDLKSVGNKRILAASDFDVIYNAGHADCSKVRTGLYKRLLLLLDYLPENVGIAVFEGFRPLWKQKEYFIKKFKELSEASKCKNSGDDFLEAMYVETCKLVSPFIDNVPVHCTGAAIDIMLFRYDEGTPVKLLNLGKFGVIFGPNDQAKTLADNISPEQLSNRKMLLDAAAKAGLINYGYEWWHYSYGDRAWAYVENRENAIYGIATDKSTSEQISKREFFDSMRKELKL